MTKYETVGLGYPDSDAVFPLIGYDPDGNCIEVILTADNFYAEYHSGNVDVYRSQKTGEVVGVFIKNVSAIVKS